MRAGISGVEASSQGPLSAFQIHRRGQQLASKRHQGRSSISNRICRRGLPSVIGVNACPRELSFGNRLQAWFCCSQSGFREHQRFRRTGEFRAGAKILHRDGVGLAVAQRLGQRIIKRVLSVSLSSTLQVGTESIRRYGRKQGRSVINLDLDRRIGLVFIPSPPTESTDFDLVERSLERKRGRCYWTGRVGSRIRRRRRLPVGEMSTEAQHES